MKKLLVLVLMLTFVISACAEGFDFSGMTDEDLQSLINAATTELHNRQEEQPAQPQEKGFAFDTELILDEIKIDQEGEYRYCYYKGIVKVTNTGSENIHLAADTFDIEDSEGRLIATENTQVFGMPSLLAPGEVGYLFTAPVMELPSTIDPEHETYHLVYSTQYIRPSDTTEIHDLEIIDVSCVDNNYNDIIGRVVNDTSRDITAQVMCIFFNENDEILGIARTWAEANANSKASFEIYGTGMYGRTDVARIEVSAREVDW